MIFLALTTRLSVIKLVFVAARVSVSPDPNPFGSFNYEEAKIRTQYIFGA